MKYENVKYPIPQRTLTATIEAMRDLQAYYEADACALARLDSKEARERLKSAETASILFGFYSDL